ncbi:hypothetical protein [Reinekea sp. G2M2-21]|nr:hypothetical protein [Reinekea sp. G2M2-21]
MTRLLGNVLKGALSTGCVNKCMDIEDNARIDIIRTAIDPVHLSDL